MNTAAGQPSDVPGGAPGGMLTARSPGRHLLAASVAAILSVGLHVGLMRLLPPLPVGKPPTLETARLDHRVEVRDIHPNDVQWNERPATFRPESPESFADLSREAQTFAEALEALPLEAPHVDVGPLEGADEALAPAEPARDRSAWEPRREVLAVEEKLFDDEVSLLPRRYQPSVPRTDVAPDIALPLELPDGASLEASAQTLADARGGGEGPARLRRSIPSGQGLGLASEAALPDEPSALLDEQPSEITELKPVENLLRIGVASFQAPDEPDTVYFRLAIERAGAESLPVLPRDVMLIQDCSESMTWRKLKKCKVGLQSWLDSLGPEDRFDLMGFREEVTRCFDGWTNQTASTRARANWFIHNLAARGRTDVYASLRELLKIVPEPGRPVLAILITDGRPTTGVVDGSDIIERFTRANGGEVSVFAFGGGTRVNRFLLDFLSYKNRGDSMVVKEQSQIPAGLEAWSRQLARPVLTDLRYHFAGLPDSEVYPRTLTHLYLDRPLVLYGRTDHALPHVAFQVVGLSGQQQHDMVFSIPWDEAEAGTPAIRREWAHQKALYLVGEHLRTQKESILKELARLEETYDVAVPYGAQYPGW